MKKDVYNFIKDELEERDYESGVMELAGFNITRNQEVIARLLSFMLKKGIMRNEDCAIIMEGFVGKEFLMNLKKHRFIESGAQMRFLGYEALKLPYEISENRALPDLVVCQFCVEEINLGLRYLPRGYKPTNIPKLLTKEIDYVCSQCGCTSYLKMKEKDDE